MTYIKTGIIAISLLISTLSPLQAAVPPAQEAAINHIDRLINQGQKQLTKIRISLNGISALIRKKDSYSKEQKDAAVKHLIQLDQMVVEGLKNEKFIQADIESAYMLLQINNALINHLQMLLQSNFKNIGAFDLETFIAQALTRKTQTLEPQEILQRLIINEQKIKDLMVKAQGLTWYNKMVRFVDDWVISPANKYSIPSRAVIAGALGAFGILALWQNEYFVNKPQVPSNNDDSDASRSRDTIFQQFFYPGSIANNYPGSIANNYLHRNTSASSDAQQASNGSDSASEEEVDDNNASVDEEANGHPPQVQNNSIVHRLLGPPPQYDKFGDISNNDELGRFGKAYGFASGIMRGHLPIPAFFLGVAAMKLKTEFSENLYPWIKKKMEEWKNYSKGGSYIEEGKRLAEKTKSVRFSDIHGQDEIKRYLKLLVEYLDDPETFDRLGLTPPKGILCIGDTRTGKTFAINALKGEIEERRAQAGSGEKFELIQLPAIVILKLGMETILEHIRKKAPCIVFIDEIDLLNLQRRDTNTTLSEFLTTMGDVLDSKDSKKQVIIIAATNRPETLDFALRQPGRFGKELRFEYPNYNDRHSFIKMKLEEFSLSVEEFDIDKIARFTENKSYESMNMVIKNAIIKARLRQELLTQAHLDEAIDEDVYHIIPKYTKHVPEQERRILAAHFAGQATLLALGKTDIKLAKVTIKQVMTELKEEMMGIRLENKDAKEQDRFEYGKVFTHHAHDSINIANKEEKLALIRMYLAGFIAEELLLGSCGYSCHAEGDKANALAYAQSITFKGIDISKMPEHIRERMHNEALALVDQCGKEARAMLEQHKDLVQKIADELLEKETLDEVQVNQLVQDNTSK